MLAFLIFVLALCQTSFAAKWPITAISDLTAPQLKVVNWIKKYTVPNTLTKDGNAWTTTSLPKALTYDKSIKPSAYAAAIVTAWSISEGIYDIHDFYRSTSKVLCPCFQSPAQPPKSDFPIQAFSYSNCQGQALNLNTNTGQTSTACDCSCTDCPAGGRLIGPNQRCRGRKEGESDWQNGIFGMEQSHVVSAEDVAKRAQNIYGKLNGASYTYVDAIDNTLQVAGFNKGSKVYDAVMTCFPVDAKTKKRKAPKAGDLTWACADMVSIWLTRNHLVGLTVAMDDNPSFIKLESNKKAILVLANYFNK